MNPADPLAQLRDIHLPDAVGVWPPAPGWWILGALLLCCLTAAGLWLRRRYLRDLFRRQALSLLEESFKVWQQDQHHQHYLGEVNAILKRVALLRFPDKQTAGLSGQAWMEFLDGTAPDSGQGFAGSALAEGAYGGKVEHHAIEQVQRLSSAWLRSHREQPHD